MNINDGNQSCEINSKKNIIIIFYYSQNIVSSINIPNMSIFPNVNGKNYFLIKNFILEQSFLEILFVSTKQNGSIKSKQAFFNNGNNISFPYSKMQFNHINVNDDIFDVYILYNNKKLQSINKGNANYYRIHAKDIGVTDDFKELNFPVVNGIELKIKIKIKNNFDNTQKVSVKDRLKFFNAKVEDSKKSAEEFHQKYKKWDSQKNKEQNTKKIEQDTKKIEQPQPKKDEQPKKVEQPKTVNQPKKVEHPKKIEQTKNNEQPKKVNPKEINTQTNGQNIKTNTNKQNIPQKEKNEIKKQPKDIGPKDSVQKPITKAPEPKKQTNLKPTVTLEKSKTFMEPNKSRKGTVKGLDPIKEEIPISKDLLSNEEIFLKPITYGQFCKEQNDRGIKHPYRETFCEGFFIASFPEKKGKIVEMSESFPSPCRHQECSKLPAMKPEIIFRYPLQDTKTLELNNLAATICFPTGIKVCYDENNGPNLIKDYVTSITNQKGERYYMMTYHFYIKYSINEYQKRYEEHPLKYNLSKFADAYTSLSEEELTEDKINEIQEVLFFSQELGNRDIIFVPFCICLISKYPYVKEMEKCLSSIYTMLNQIDENNGLIINDLITYLIHSIPIPAKNTNVNFLVPYQKKCIQLDCPKLEDINIMSASATELLKNFSIDNLLIIFRLLITEKKILLIDEDYARLSKVADGLISILYPFQWIHTYIPIMSDQMLKYLETFLPFLNGINKSLMSFVEKVFKEGEMEEDDEVFLIYISDDRDKIRLSSSIRGIKKKVDKYINDNIPPLPYQLEKDLKNKLKKAKSELESKTLQTLQDFQRLELKIRDAFIDLFVEMFHDYAQYLSFLEEDTVFNKSLFLEKKKNDELKFYNEVLDTQLFQQFTQNVVNEEVEYFNTKIAKKENKEEAKDKKNKDIIKRYNINPEFLKLELDINNSMKNLEQSLTKKYTKKKRTHILEKAIIIEDDKYKEKECKIYMTPEEKELSKEKKEEKKPKKKVIVASSNNILNKIKALKLDAVESVKSKGALSEKEQENMKELIKDYVVKIFKSEEIVWEAKEKTDLMNKLNFPFGRDFFISLLSKNTLNVILLKDNSFHLLFQLIYNCIINTLKLEETDDILRDLVLLIKSTKYFGITELGSNCTMFEKYKTKIQGVPKIRQDNFWQIWYETETTKKKDLKVEDKQEIIYDICKTLISLELPKSMIKKLTDNINIKLFGKGSELQKKTFDVFIKFIINAKYVSQAI